MENRLRQARGPVHSYMESVTYIFTFFLQGTQYIGEICRYLLATPVVPEEKQHKIRIMFGNGLRPQIWKEFVTRFNIPNIAEFCEYFSPYSIV